MNLDFPIIEQMIKDQHANHVIQKLIENGFCNDIQKVKSNYNQGNTSEMLSIIVSLNKIFLNFKSNAYELCVHALGCRVIQKFIECMPTD